MTQRNKQNPIQIYTTNIGRAKKRKKKKELNQHPNRFSLEWKSEWDLKFILDHNSLIGMSWVCLQDVAFVVVLHFPEWLTIFNCLILLSIAMPPTEL